MAVRRNKKACKCVRPTGRRRWPVKLDVTNYLTYQSTSMNKSKQIEGQKQTKRLLCPLLRSMAVMAMLLCSLGVYAQTLPVTLNLKDTKLSAALTEIEKQTSYVFSYDNSVNTDATISISVSNMPLSRVLPQLLDPQNIAYEVRNNSIVLSRKAEAPQAKKIAGRVLDANGQPVIGATVVVKGTSTGTATDLDGNFTLTVPASSKELTVSYIGMTPRDISIGHQTTYQITLESSTIKVDDVVVTAMGIKRSTKALNYNVQSVANDQLTKVKDANFINSLNGKVAGVNINTSSSGVGGASKVVMRGSKSIMQSSNAIYVIDGVPMTNFGGEGDQEFGSKGTTEAIADINPEDIESVSVLTGAAAAALYGSSAANGAIVITTKKGKAGKAEVIFSSNTEIIAPFVMPKFQNIYGTGDTNSSVEVLDRSWGNKLNPSNYMGYDPAKDYFQRGLVTTETISVSRGNERNQVYLSAGAINSEGIVPNNTYDRYNFTFRNTSQLIDDKLTLDVNASYVMQKDMNMVNQGVYMNPLVSAYLFPRGNDWNDIQMYERWDTGRNIYTQYWPSGAGTYVMQNPYWINNRNLRSNDKDRYMLGASLDYKPLEWLSVVGRIRIDNTNNTYEEKFYATTNTLLTSGSNRGFFGQTLTRDKQTYGDIMANFNKTIGDDWTVQANVGASFVDSRYWGTAVRGPIRDKANGDSTPGVTNSFHLEQLSDVKTTRDQTDWHEQTQSIFASAEVGYKGAYYLTVTGRNDWPSQLAGPGSGNSSFFYPSVGGAVVLSEIFNLGEQVSFLKLRGSFASVGVAFKRYLANPSYDWNNDTKLWRDKTYYPVNDLKPERTRSWEVGMAANFLKHFNIDLSFYSAKTSNQTFEPGISPGSGYSTMYIQSGDILNEGVELSLGYKNTWNKFSWNSNYTFSSNRNKILSIGENAYNPITGEKLDIGPLDVGGLGQTRFILQKGGTLGDIYSRTDLQRDSNGDIYVDPDGNIRAVAVADGQWIKLGSVLPDANMAWNNSFSWKNVSAGLLFAARLGGVVYSRTQSAMDYYGVSEATAIARDNGGVWINGGDLIDANKWYTTIATQDGVSQFYTYSATNVRLQEASIGYTIPTEKLGNMMSITLSLVGRNLWMIYNKAPFDPEAVATTGNYYQGIDYFMMPSTRNIGFNIRIKF